MSEGWTRLKIQIDGEPRAELHTQERDAAGEWWLVTYELRDGKTVEVRRVNARNVTL